jgi:hypothetical protein
LLVAEAGLLPRWGKLVGNFRELKLGLVAVVEAPFHMVHTSLAPHSPVVSRLPTLRNTLQRGYARACCGADAVVS